MSLILLAVLAAAFLSMWLFVKWQEMADIKDAVKTERDDARTQHARWYAAAGSMTELFSGADMERQQLRTRVQQLEVQLGEEQGHRRKLLADMDAHLLSAIQEQEKSRLLVDDTARVRDMVTRVVKDAVIMEVFEAILKAVPPDETIESGILPLYGLRDGTISFCEEGDRVHGLSR